MLTSRLPYLLLPAFWFAGALAALATQPPPAGSLEEYQRDGTLARRQEFARKTGNYQVNPDLARRKIAQMKAQQAGQKPGLEKFPYQTGLPSKGAPRTFALLIDFPDYPHVNAEAVFANKLFGAGDAAEKPYESLREFYRRSSYYYSKPAGQGLDIQGDVLPWYRAKHNRGYYTSAETLIKEALNQHTIARNFAIYDNNGDGSIDFFMAFYTGPDTGWGSQWWAWENNFEDTYYTLDGKKLKAFCFQWESNPVGAVFMPHVVIHETGHGLGLPDLYDYNNYLTVGPQGGVGGLDMMDHNWGDHNGFSKWLLDWLTPTVIGAGGAIQLLNLRPSASYPDAVVIMPGASVANPFAEFFLVQNRSRGAGLSRGTSITNDMDYPADGLLIWHIDARLNIDKDNFNWNNSYTAHKLVRLMEADGREDIQYKNKEADAGDFYGSPHSLTNTSLPNSRNYANQPTGVAVFNLFPQPSGGGLPRYTWNASFVISSAAIMGIGEAVENKNLAWMTGGSAPGVCWYGQTGTYYYLNNAAQSTSPGHGGHATMGAWVSGPSSIRFYWKVSSEKNADFLDFSIDGVSREKISGEVNWAPKTFPIPEGSHYLEWKYSKNAAGTAGSDRGWVDKVEGGAVALGEALDNPARTFTNGSGPGWFGQVLQAWYGGSAAQSGQAGNNGQSSFSTSVTGPAGLSFYWKVSSQANGDFLELLLDGVKQKAISGEVDWQAATLAIPAGTHTVTWRYIKNGSVAAGADCGWVDLAVITDPKLADGVDNHFLSWNAGGSAPWVYTTGAYSNAQEGADSLACTVDDTTTAILSTTVIGPGTLSFWWKDTVINSWGGNLQFGIKGVHWESIDKAGWQQKTIAVPAGVQELVWVYQASFMGDAGTGWLDWITYVPESLTLNEAVDYAGTLVEAVESPTRDWYAGLDLTAYGADSARSGAIGNSQSTALTMAVTGPGILTFNWKASCDISNANLRFLLDDKYQAGLGGLVDWQALTALIPAGNHTLTWDYRKGALIGRPVGLDCGWVDRVQFKAPPPLGEALDNPGLGWSTTASARAGEWMGQPLVSYYGGSSAQSGPLAAGQSATLATSMFTGPGTIRFAWKVACHAGTNYLAVSVGNAISTRGGLPFIVWQEAARISGYTPWSVREIAIPSGTRLVRWQYVKNGAFADDGQDRGWVDKVVLLSPNGAGRDWALYQ